MQLRWSRLEKFLKIAQVKMKAYVDARSGGVFQKGDWVYFKLQPYRQERLNRSLMVCQDKFESAKLQKIRTDATNDLESCVDQSVQDSINTLPHLVRRLKTSLSINE
ncbi:hypothetical protein AgCh_038526 [Apium graveolens]